MQLKLEGHLDMDRCGKLARELSHGLNAGETVTLDFTHVESVDSAALALILEMTRMTQAKSTGLTLRQLPQSLMALAALYGVEFLLQPTTGNHL